MPASSTSATATASSSRWRATTTPPTSSPTRARRPASAASCATSSPWARGPIAAMNALRFGAPDHPKTRHLVSGVVAGIGGYGNAFGVPTVGGEVNFDARYNGNILVNAFAAGLAKTDAIFYSQGQGRRPAGRLSRRQDRPRRRRRRDHGLGRVRRQDRGEAPDRAGRRPLHRKVPARGLPRTDGDRRGHRHPGHGRGRPHLLGGRDGRQGRPRHRARPRQGAGARGAHDAPTR